MEQQRAGIRRAGQRQVAQPRRGRVRISLERVHLQDGQNRLESQRRWHSFLFRAGVVANFRHSRRMVCSMARPRPAVISPALIRKFTAI